LLRWEERPRRRITPLRPWWSGDELRPASFGHVVGVDCARCSSNSRSPPVLRLLITRPGGVSPRSHSIQNASSLAGSGAGVSTALEASERGTLPKSGSIVGL